MSLELTSNEFESGGTYPARYTCSGENLSPPLRWRNLPEETETLALIMDDPDAPNGPFSHWVLYNIPANVDRISAGVPVDGRMEWGANQGRNDFGDLGYGGPCPPPGPAHHYYFRLYALDRDLNLPPGATRGQLRNEMEGHILDRTETVVEYGRTV